jgi:hypothetical protein
MPRNSEIRAVTREARGGLTAVPGARYPTVARALIGIAAFLAFALSVTLYFSGDETAGIFVAVWVPSILSLGAFLVPRRADETSIGGGDGQ